MAAEPPLDSLGPVLGSGSRRLVRVGLTCWWRSRSRGSQGKPELMSPRLGPKRRVVWSSMVMAISVFQRSRLQASASGGIKGSLRASGLTYSKGSLTP